MKWAELTTDQKSEIMQNEIDRASNASAWEARRMLRALVQFQRGASSLHARTVTDDTGTRALRIVTK